MRNIKIKQFINRYFYWFILLMSLIVFLALAEDVFSHEIMKGDVIGYHFVSTYLINDFLTPIMKGITWFGSAIPLIIITLLSFLIKDKRMGKMIGTNLVFITIFNQLLKALLQRPRPIEYRIIHETGYSFPSGHSMVSMAFYGFLIYLIYKHIHHKYLKWFLITVLSVLIILIGISRIYLGVHYVSDVIAGFAISIDYLIVFIHVVNRFNREGIVNVQ